MFSTASCPIIVTTSHYSSRIVAERSRQAQEAGAAMVMIMPPFFGATMRVDEAGIAVRAVRENTGLEVVASFTFDRKTDAGWRTMMGVSPEQMVEEMLAAGAHILGANCSLGSAEMAEVVAALRAAREPRLTLVY